MPQLLPRTDSVGWVTPALSQIIETNTVETYNDQEKRDQLNLFRARLAQAGVNADVMDIQTAASHLRYYLRPAGESIAPNNYELFINQLRQALPDIKKVLTATSAEVLVSPQKPLIVQLLVRPANHTTFQLGHLLRSREFVESPSQISIPFGLDIDQTPVIRTIEEMRHLLVVGEATTRFHFIAAALTTLGIFNSPLELRYALIGQDTDPFDQLAQTPHVLGGTLTSVREMIRLLDGLVKHLGQRKQQFSRLNVTSLDAYNNAVVGQGQKPFPRLLMVVDTIPFEEDWNSQRESWFSGLYRLVKEGPSVGIHTILTAKNIAPEQIPPQLLSLLKTKLVLRPAIGDVEIRSAMPILPSPFVEAVLLEEKGSPIQLELPEVEDKTVGTLTRYWRQTAAKRSMAALAQGQQRPTGDTGLLTLRQDARLKVARLSSRPPAAEKETAASAPKPTVATATVPEVEVEQDVYIRRARALATYLGWLGLGPLMDVLDLSVEDARSTIALLQTQGYLEDGDGPTWRFQRLDK